ncbi:MAG: VanZ family protein, partial [Terracidiphilus sp.]
MSSSARAERLTTPQTRTGSRGPWYWFGVWWPVALGIAVISLESQSFMGADHTTGPLRAAWQFLFGHVSDASWEILHHYIRKSGHFTGYGLIGLAWLRAWWMTLPHSRFLTDAALAMLGTATIASCDEWHQSFLPNRTSSVWDVLLDCCGALVMITLVYVYARIRQPQRLA